MIVCRDVLSINKREDEYKISDVQVDDFVMFRYELNSIFRKHHYVDEAYSEYLIGGRNPLSKIQGKQLKDVDDKKNYLEMYRPPGIVERVETNVGIKSSQLDEKIWNTMPTTKLYRRGKPDEK